jgi:hypothetical protein
VLQRGKPRRRNRHGATQDAREPWWASEAETRQTEALGDEKKRGRRMGRRPVAETEQALEEPLVSVESRGWLASLAEAVDKLPRELSLALLLVEVGPGAMM